MLSYDEHENDRFFDCVDCLSFNVPNVENFKFDNDDDDDKLEYELWINEPVSSVKERRQSFLRKMNLVQFSDLNEKSEIIDTERSRECSTAISNFSNSDDLVCGRDEISEANCMVDEFEHEAENQQSIKTEPLDTEHRCSTDGSKQKEQLDSVKRAATKWLKRLVSMKRRESMQIPDIRPSPKTNRMKVKQKNKKCAELTGLFARQDIKAHKGSIFTMKFSPDGQYLATGGSDGVVCIWRVTSTYVSSDSFLSEDNSCNQSIVFPEKVFHIEDSPVHKFHGHSRDVLDLAWSSSNFLVSCSTDKTVRLWQVGSECCLHVFHHSDYVTCVQFNPMDDNYFISGSIDGKVRIWGLSEKRVVDYAEVRDVITAVCYQPDGNVFVVGTITGTCSFYNLEPDAEVHIPYKKKLFGKRITGIQYSKENYNKVMISSEDSKLQILDGLDVVSKFKGLPKSRSQMSASFTSTEKHIVSVGGDSRVYVWNYDDHSAKHTKPVQIQSCEHFVCEGACVAVPWSENRSTIEMQVHDVDEWNGGLRARDVDRFSLGSWLFNDKGSTTWPEEKLPLYDSCPQNSKPVSWGLVIVTGGWDGIIRTFHNYGLPIRLP
ncbi:hypothetical protein ACFE04_012953 [Oxalis oulophora]